MRWRAPCHPCDGNERLLLDQQQTCGLHLLSQVVVPVVGGTNFRGLGEPTFAPEMRCWSGTCGVSIPSIRPALSENVRYVKTPSDRLVKYSVRVCLHLTRFFIVQVNTTLQSTHMNELKTGSRALDLDEVMAALRISKTAVYNKGCKSSKYYDPTFPARFKIGERSVRWDASEIAAWLEKKKEERL